MTPLLVLIVLFAALSAAGHFGVPASFGWWTALRLALAGMFLLTASAHWGRRRADLVRMVPPGFARPALAVSLTGALEILGAVGLAIPGLARYAALALGVLLLAVFPANIHAARRRLTIAGAPVPALIPRTLIQIAFLAATLAVFLDGPANLR